MLDFAFNFGIILGFSLSASSILLPIICLIVWYFRKDSNYVKKP